MSDDILNISDEQKEEFEKFFNIALVETARFDGSQKWFDRFRAKVGNVERYIRGDILGYKRAVKVSDENAMAIYDAIYPEYISETDLIKTPLDFFKVIHAKSGGNIKKTLEHKIKIYPTVIDEISDELKRDFKRLFDDVAKIVTNYEGKVDPEKYISAFQQKFDNLDAFIEKRLFLSESTKQLTQTQKRSAYDLAYPEHVNQDRPKTISDLKEMIRQLGKDFLQDADIEPEAISSNTGSKVARQPLSQKKQDVLRKKTRVFIKSAKDHGTTANIAGKIFVPTHSGSIEAGEGQGFFKEYEPRLMILMEHLNKQGIEGQTVAYKDIHIEYGDVTKDMLRPEPYNIVRIEKLDIEIAVADCIGEATFVKKGISGEKFWMQMDKNALGAHKHVHRVIRNNDAQWWQEISDVISGKIEPSIDIQAYKIFQTDGTPISRELAKETILAEKLAYDRDREKKNLLPEPNGGWVTAKKRREDGGPYIFQHGPYAGLLTVTGLQSNVEKGSRGFPGGEELADLKKEISDERGMGYVNKYKQEEWDIKDIEKSLLLYAFREGNCIDANLKETEQHNNGTYLFEVKTAKGSRKVPIKRLNRHLSAGRFGLTGGSSVGKQYNQMAEEIGVKGSGVKQSKKRFTKAVNLGRETLLQEFKGNVDEMMTHLNTLSFDEILQILKENPANIEYRQGLKNE